MIITLPHVFNAHPEQIGGGYEKHDLADTTLTWMAVSIPLQHSCHT